ncbi:MAG: FecR domain-containing protein [Cyclobacteriaceae bacterium]
MKTKEDFLCNPEFVRWVRQPDKHLDAYWKKWIKANPDQVPTLKLAKEFLLKVKYADIKPEKGIKQEILNDLLRVKPIPGSLKSSKEERSKIQKANFEKSNWFYRIVALLIVGFGLGWFSFQDQVDFSSLKTKKQNPLVRKTTASGEKLQFTLSDGTRVWLNSVTELSFPEKFDSTERKVFLNGEAFFEVEKDSLRPFRVVSDDLVTTALGTSFNVTNKDSNKINVALATGKVQVKFSENAENVMLVPGQKLTFFPSTKEKSIDSFDPNEDIAWKDGILVFRDSTLEEVVKELEDWFGVKISLRNSEDVNWKFSGEYHNQTLENILKSMSYIQGFKYEINNKSVELKF